MDYWRESHSVRVFVTKTVKVIFFRSVCIEVATKKQNGLLAKYEKNVLIIEKCN